MAEATKRRPPGVTMLALFCFVFGGSFAFGVRFFASWLSHPVAGFLINPIAGIVVIVCLAVALVQAGFFIALGIGLLKMQNWARVSLIVLSMTVLSLAVLGMVGSVVHVAVAGLASLVVVIAIAASMFVYLFKPRVKEMFGATNI